MLKTPVTPTPSRARTKPSFFANFGGPRKPRSVISLLGGDEGALTVMFALTASMMIGTMATMLDVIDGTVTQTRLQMAIDVAALSAGADLAHYSSTTGSNYTQWQADARAYYDANMPGGYMSFSIPSGSFSATVSGSPTTGQTIQLTASGSQPLFAPYIWGTAGTSSGSNSGSSTPTTQTISASNTALRMPKSTLELALILDNTGSMSQTADGSTPSSKNPAQTKLQGLQTAANALISQIFSVTSNDSYIGLVPFTTMVNVKGALNTSGTWMEQNTAKQFAYNANGVSMNNWGGCVVEPHDSGGNISPSAYAPKNAPGFTPFYFNVPPAGFTVKYYDTSCNVLTKNPATVFNGVPVSFYYGYNNPYGWSTLCQASNYAEPTPYNFWAQTNTNSKNNNVTYDQNGSDSDSRPCSIQPVQFLTKNQTTLTNAVNAMTANGSTIIPSGLLWGWRMLSSDWSGSVAGTNNGWISSDTTLPRPETTQGLQRVAILLTDGENDPGTPAGLMPQPYFNQFAVGNQTLKAPTLGLNGVISSPDNLNTFQLGVCSAMKQSGIIIYSITFGAYGTDSASVAAQQTMQSCATPGNYYHAPDNTTLNTIFQQIAGNLGVLRLTQ
jgi:Flp pilus assembly protein TadG